VVVLIVIVCAEEYVPPAGLKVGNAAGGVMVYAAIFTRLAELPVATATALSATVVEMVMGPVYTGELVVGVDPSAV
jgi:hypothetical protein